MHIKNVPIVLLDLFSASPILTFQSSFYLIKSLNRRDQRLIEDVVNREHSCPAVRCTLLGLKSEFQDRESLPASRLRLKPRPVSHRGTRAGPVVRSPLD